MDLNAAQPLRLLFLVPFAPRLDGRHGGARVTGQLIAQLAARHEVAILYLADAEEPPLEDELVTACAVVERVERTAGPPALRDRARIKAELLRAVPTWAGELASPRFEVRVAGLAAAWRPDVVQFEFPVMGRYLPALRGCPAPRVLVDHDAGLRDLRDWGGPLGRVVGALDERAWRRFERRVLGQMDAAVVFTERDRRALEGLGTDTPVHEIPFGVPLPDVPLDPAGEPPPTVLFVGNFRHAANVDAATWLGETIFPPLRRTVAGVRLSIVGSSPTPDVRALAGDAVAVAGSVPAVDPHLDRAAVVAAPLRVGAGMRVKVLEALAAGKAVVATPVAVEGLDVAPGEQLEVAASAPEFTAALERLLRDEQRRRALAGRARAWACERLGWEHAVDRYERLYRELTAR